ncbi:hypothetical protein SO802_032523 [Lithocarpus litseifolius]|uniref:Uncharacterized protein n=1 Tax=Lithocarpus litseifolius TaxID=425828 RepID=A0AAW2BC61_9ROSI
MVGLERRESIVLKNEKNGNKDDLMDIRKITLREREREGIRIRVRVIHTDSLYNYNYNSPNRIVPLRFKSNPIDQE